MMDGRPNQGFHDYAFPSSQPSQPQFPYQFPQPPQQQAYNLPQQQGPFQFPPSQQQQFQQQLGPLPPQQPQQQQAYVQPRAPPSSGGSVGSAGFMGGLDNVGNVTQSTGLPGQAQRKRPKYTRSKAGCLTCRTKKIKCDELHPICTRCLQSHRECVWPPDAPQRRSKPASAPGSSPGTPQIGNRPHPYANPNRPAHMRTQSHGHLVPGGSRSHSPPSGAESGASLGVPSPATSGSAPGSSGGRRTSPMGPGGYGQSSGMAAGEMFDPNLLPLLNAMQQQQLGQRAGRTSSNASPEMPPLPGDSTAPTAASSTGMPPTPPGGIPGSSGWFGNIGNMTMLPSPQIHNTALKFPTVDGEWWDAGQVFSTNAITNGEKDASNSNGVENNNNGALINGSSGNGTGSPSNTDLAALLSLYPSPPTNPTDFSPSSLFPPFSFGNANSPPLAMPGQPYPLAPAQNPLSPLGNLSPPPLDASFVAQLQALQGMAPYGAGGISPAQGQWGNTLGGSRTVGALEGPQGSAPGTNGDLGQPLMAGPDPFEPYFQTVEERNLVRLHQFTQAVGGC
ncbi:hypothetical protein CALCODRAFT_102473 [Calocera cornea HHB12733]|uniref:Zn(2)-C6 fungal-type domain-containing protein n=1 Tax=Calocera cornea HHB12733 TaxID=1353952 RepID=A0A165D549_9BASI|nr:hypothetical protein CALCODRAFT_102473 [Calocera cornea HHB12733]